MREEHEGDRETASGKQCQRKTDGRHAHSGASPRTEGRCPGGPRRVGDHEVVPVKRHAGPAPEPTSR
jgi:hypothetical protein